MKSRYKRAAVKVSGKSVMRGEPVYKSSNPKLTQEEKDYRDGLLIGGTHPTIVVKKLAATYGVQTNYSTHQNRKSTLRTMGLM